jgi:hypothetical protein
MQICKKSVWRIFYDNLFPHFLPNFYKVFYAQLKSAQACWEHLGECMCTRRPQCWRGELCSAGWLSIRAGPGISDHTPFFLPLPSSIGGISPHATPPHLSNCSQKRVKKSEKICIPRKMYQLPFVFRWLFIKMPFSSLFLCLFRPNSKFEVLFTQCC